MLSDRSLQDIAFLMSDLGPLVPRPTHLVGKRFSFGFSLSFDLGSSLLGLKVSFPSNLLVPSSRLPRSSISWYAANGAIRA